MKFPAIVCFIILLSTSLIDEIAAQRDNTTQVVDVYNPKTGKVWMDRNLGANRAATSSTDTEAYGDLYQWGRRADGHQKRNSSTVTTLSNTDTPSHGSFILAPNTPGDWRSPQNNNLWQGVNGVNNPCPVGYRIPTITEWERERQSWSSNNAAGAISSALKLPLGGRRYKNDGSITDDGYFGFYWSNNIQLVLAEYLRFDSFSTNARVLNSPRGEGYSVRCIKEVVGRDTETAVVEVVNPATGRIWMDRNLGATRAATSPTDTQAYGDLYQWGRGADGHQKRNSPTTSNTNNTDTPSHGSFILAPNSPNDWRIPQNPNLWQGVNGINNPCPFGYRIPTNDEWEEERKSWSNGNRDGAFASPLRLTAAAYRFRSNGAIINATDGYYWSSSTSFDRSSHLYFLTSSANNSDANRAFGYSVRCIKDAEATSIESEDHPKQYYLDQNYPNPFNPTTQIRFALPESQQVTIQVYDVNGRLVAELLNNKTYSAGNHQVTFDGSGLSSGIYIYTMRTSSGMAFTRKLLLVK